MPTIKTIFKKNVSKINQGNSVSTTDFDIRGNTIRFVDDSSTEKRSYDSVDNLLGYENYRYNKSKSEIIYNNSKELKENKY